MKCFKSFFTLVLILFVTFSCNKDHFEPTQIIQEKVRLEQTDAFFTDDYVTRNNENVVPIKNAQERSQDKNKFKKKIKDYFKDNPAAKDTVAIKIGSILWDRITYYQFDNNQLAILPIAKNNSEFTKGILVAFLDDTETILRLAHVIRNEFDHLPTEQQASDAENKRVDLELILSYFLIFDKDIFDYYDCELIDLYKPYLKEEELRSDRASSRTTACYYSYEITSVTDYYTCVGTISDLYQYCSYDYSVNNYNWTTYCEETYPGGTGGGTGGGGSGGTSSGDGSSDSTSGEDNSDNIDPTKAMINANFKCLYNKFMEGNFSLFNSTIRKFEQTDNVTLAFDITTSNPHTDASKLTSDNLITIYLNPNEANSILDLADQILHEGIHAAIDVYLAKKGVDVKLYNRERLIQLYDYYKKYNNSNYQDHIYMAENYVEPIAQTLRQLDGNKYFITHYYGIVWEGIGYWATYIPKLRDKYDNYSKYNSIVRSNTDLCKLQ